MKLSQCRSSLLLKSEVLARGLQSQILVPQCDAASPQAYLRSLADTDEVQVLNVEDTALNQAFGKKSNNRRDFVRELFITFVRQHRSPTGRTPDKDGRHHGAEFFLSSQFTAIVKQRGERAKNFKHAACETLAEVYCHGTHVV